MKIRNLIPTFIISALLFLSPFEMKSDVLYWTIKDDANMPSTMLHNADGSTIPLSEYIAPYDDSYSVRIRVTGDGVSPYTFLTVYDGEGWVDGEIGVWVGHDLVSEGGSGWFTSGITASDLGIYDSQEYSFLMEIGEYFYNESTGEDAWVRTIAASSPKTREELRRFTHPGGVAVPSDIWNPRDFYMVVPEPDTTILLSIGLSLLLLRRKNIHE